MIAVDPVTQCVPTNHWRWPKVAHLFCLPGEEDELHAFAARIGLKREWYQDCDKSRGQMPHYNLTPNMRRKAVNAGAKALKPGQMLEHVLNIWKTERS